MPALIIDRDWCAGPVRIRASAIDQYAGLRGHDYVAARGLNQPAQRLDAITPEREQAVLNVIAAESRRHKPRTYSIHPKRRTA